MEWLHIQFNSGNTYILYAVYADFSGYTENPENTPVERSNMINMISLPIQRAMFKAFLGVLGLNPTVLAAEVDANITGFFDIVTALITQVLSWMTSMTTWVMGNSLASLFFAIMLLMLAIHVLHSLIKFS